MKVINEVKKRPRSNLSLRRRVELNIALLLLAAVMIGMGVYLFSKPQWTQRADIRLYDLGVSSYALPAGLLPATDDRPAEYPVSRAAAYFQQSASQSKDKIMIGKSLYNLGTLMAYDAVSSLSGGTSSFGLADAIKRLAEAVRADPSNENAKYNLELLQQIEELLKTEPIKHNMPMAALLQKPGYYAGDVDKGF